MSTVRIQHVWNIVVQYVCSTYSTYGTVVFNICAICIQYVFNVWNIGVQYVFSMYSTYGTLVFNIVSICVQYVFSMPAIC